MSQRIHLAAIVHRDGQLLLVRHTEAHPWELPGGALLPEHDDTEAAMRQILASFGITTAGIEEDFLDTIFFRGEAGNLIYNLYAPTDWAGAPLAPVGASLAWFAPDELHRLEMDSRIRDAVLTAFGMRSDPGQDDRILAELQQAMDLAPPRHSEPPGAPVPPMPSADLMDAGRDVLRTLTAGPAEVAEARMRTAYPELADDVIAAIGATWARPTIDRRTRSLQVVAMLAALGGRPGPLRGHINGALNHGATPEEVVETLRMVAVYAGFPAALEAWPVLESVFQQRGIERPGSD